MPLGCGVEVFILFVAAGVTIAYTNDAGIAAHGKMYQVARSRYFAALPVYDTDIDHRGILAIGQHSGFVRCYYYFHCLTCSFNFRSYFLSPLPAYRLQYAWLI